MNSTHPRRVLLLCTLYPQVCGGSRLHSTPLCSSRTIPATASWRKQDETNVLLRRSSRLHMRRIHGGMHVRHTSKRGRPRAAAGCIYNSAGDRRTQVARTYVYGAPASLQAPARAVAASSLCKKSSVRTRHPASPSLPSTRCRVALGRRHDLMQA